MRPRLLVYIDRFDNTGIATRNKDATRGRFDSFSGRILFCGAVTVGFVGLVGACGLAASSYRASRQPRSCNCNVQLLRNYSASIALTDPEDYGGGELEFFGTWGAHMHVFVALVERWEVGGIDARLIVETR